MSMEIIVFKLFVKSYDSIFCSVGLNSTYLLPALIHYIWPPPDIVKVLKAYNITGDFIQIIRPCKTKSKTSIISKIGK